MKVFVEDEKKHDQTRKREASIEERKENEGGELIHFDHLGPSHLHHQLRYSVKRKVSESREGKKEQREQRKRQKRTIMIFFVLKFTLRTDNKPINRSGERDTVVAC